MHTQTTQPTTDPKQAPKPPASQHEQRGAQRTPQQARVRAFAPPVDVFESPEAITVLVDVPGVCKEHVTLRLEKNELSIVATRTESLQGPIEYRRTFRIPNDIDGDAIVADLAKGVLALTLPRQARAKPRTIQLR